MDELRESSVYDSNHKNNSNHNNYNKIQLFTKLQITIIIQIMTIIHGNSKLYLKFKSQTIIKHFWFNDDCNEAASIWL